MNTTVLQKALYYITDENENVKYELPYVMSFSGNEDMFWFESDFIYKDFKYDVDYSFCATLYEVSPYDIEKRQYTDTVVAKSMKYAGKKAKCHPDEKATNLIYRYYFIK